VNLEQWTKALADWFLSEEPARPLYLSATPAELERMNASLELGLADPIADLQNVVNPGNFNYLIYAHGRWKKDGQNEPPPWLPFLAASVLVVEAQTDAKSTEFYIAFSNFIGRKSRLTQEEYESTLHRWWVSLATWLDQTEAGNRGFPTWRAIPEKGPRSVIGHPYTQVLLRREDRRDLDAFLSDFSAENADLPSLTDRRAAGRHLVAALRRWANGRYSISGRLRMMLESGTESSMDTLAYLLLDRLFDRRVENAAVTSRRIQTVPVFDEFDRELHLAAIAPSWVSTESPLDLDLFDGPMTEPGQPYFLAIQATDALLLSGEVLELRDGLSLVLEGREHHPLARREWDLWCGARNVALDEDIYLLARSGREDKLGIARFRSAVAGMPAGWSAYGPTRLAGADPAISGMLVEKGRRLIPRLRGGLAVDGRRTFLRGGEPVIELPGIDDTARVDGQEEPIRDEELRLSDLGLPVGEHAVEAGPFRFAFTSVGAARLPDIIVHLGRSATGDVQRPEEATGPILSGIVEFPQRAAPWHLRLTPPSSDVTLLGIPGEVGIVAPTRAGWAERAGLPHVAQELAARSSYPFGDRIVKSPWFVAWEDASGWWIAPWNLNSRQDEEPWIDPAAWLAAIEPIGPEPHIYVFGAESELTPAEVLARWRRYITTGVEP
jgi:hypothetical protein